MVNLLTLIPLAEILDLAKLFVADAPMKKMFVLPLSEQFEIWF